jgi:hypothetical protein
MRLPVAALFAAALSALSLAALAGGVIQGEVTDALGKKPVAGAAMTLVAAELGSPRSATTDAAGAYRFDDLPPTTYSVQVQAAGYQPFTRTGVALRADRSLRVNIPLLPRDMDK